MASKAYIKGRNKEYKVVKRLKDEGCDIAQRTAGSHCPFDVIGVDISEMEIYLVQAKPDTMPEIQKKRILKKNERLNGFYYVRFSVE